MTKASEDVFVFYNIKYGSKSHVSYILQLTINSRFDILV